MHRLTLAIALVAALALPAAGQTVTVGTTSLGGDSNAYPFGDAALALDRYQQVYDASAFTGAMTIGGLDFFVDPWRALGGYDLMHGQIEIYLGYASAGVGGLSTLDLSSNVTAAQLFATLAIDEDNDTGGGLIRSSGSLETAWALALQGIPFFYDPALGNLLLDIRLAGVAQDYREANPSMGMLAANSGLTSAVFAFEGGGAGTNGGLTTRFTTTPEPATLFLVGSGLAGLLLLHRRRRA